MDEKIDFVVLWVDYSDKKWLKEKEKYAIKENENVDKRECRYRDWENLKYWFRAVEKNATWVNKIHFVTHGHVPKWLNTKHPKLNIVKHEDFMPKEYLPTFNSNAIELNLHRIKSLSENFVLFNDDTFIVKKVKKEDFFYKGLPCETAILNPIISSTRDGFEKTLQNNMAIINYYFNKRDVVKRNFFKWVNFKYRKNILKSLCLFPWKKFPGFLNLHISTSIKKETLNELWEKEKTAFNETSKTKFRNNSENINQWLIGYWQMVTGKFHPRDINFGRAFSYGEDDKELYESIIKQKYKIVCLNDSSAEFNFEEEKTNTIEAFEKILPDKSLFEL